MHVPLDAQHIISTQANGVIGQALADEARALGAKVLSMRHETGSLHYFIQQFEAYKQQYPQALFIYAANAPTIEGAPIVSIEGIKAVTFGQKVQGQPMLTVLSDSWIDFSKQAQLNGQTLEVTNPQLFAQAFWRYLLQGEEQ